MLQRYVLVANAVVSALFGLGLVFAANSVLGLYGGMSMEPATDRLFGGALLGIALLNVLARDITDGDARRAVFLGNFVYNLVASWVAITGIASVGTPVAWVTSALAVIFTIAFGYFAVSAMRVAGPVTSRAT